MALPGGLNERAWRLADHLATQAASLRITTQSADGMRWIDCGIEAPGGLQAGLALARVCLAGLADVGLTAGEAAQGACPLVTVSSDHPVAACMASQYAGWRSPSVNSSWIGPMRAAYGKEALFDVERAANGHSGRWRFGSEKKPIKRVRLIWRKNSQPPISAITLLAPAASLAGTIQVVARSKEQRLHKLFELKFDLTQIVRARRAPCRPWPRMSAPSAEPPMRSSMAVERFVGTRRGRLAGPGWSLGAEFGLGRSRSAVRRHF